MNTTTQTPQHVDPATGMTETEKSYFWLRALRPSRSRGRLRNTDWIMTKLFRSGEPIAKIAYESGYSARRVITAIAREEQKQSE